MEGPPTRRGFLGMIAVGLSALLASFLSLPFLAALISPARRAGGPPEPPGGFIPVIQVWDLPTGIPRRVEVVAGDVDGWARLEQQVLGAVWLIKRSATEVKAFSTTCPHLGCSINASGTGFSCPCHASAFGLDGEVKGGPSPRSMDPLEVKVEQDTVLVRHARFRQGRASREEI